VLWEAGDRRARLEVRPRDVTRPGRTTVPTIDPASMFAWPEELGTPLHYEAAHGRDAVTAYLPALYLNSVGAMAVFAAPVETVEGVLPSDDLHPIRLDRRRAAVAVCAFLHERWWCRTEGGGVLQGDPYGEVFVAPLCTFGASAPPMLPLTGLPLPAPWRVGMFVQHMPVTHWLAEAAGRRIANFPKFVADVDFQWDAGGVTCRVAEDGTDILEFSVRRTGTVRALEEVDRMFTVAGGRLLRSDMSSVSAAQVTRTSGTARLQLGGHQMADDLRALEVEERSIGASSYLSFSARLEAPVDVGPARSHDGLRGADREHGRLTVAHFGSEPVEVYAERSRTPHGPANLV
jgi:hypothetical protein